MASESIRSALYKMVLPAAEEHLRPIIKDKAIDTMTSQKQFIDQNLSQFIQTAFDEALVKAKVKLSVLNLLESILGKDVLDKIFGHESQDKVFSKICDIYEGSKPEAGDKAADATIDALKDVLNGQHMNADRSIESTNRSIFTEFKNDMQSALSDAAKGGNVLNEKLSHTRNSLLEKSDGILQKVLDVVKSKIDSETRSFLDEHLRNRSLDLMNKLDFKSSSEDRSVGSDGFRSFLNKAADKLNKHASGFLENPKEKIKDVLHELQDKVATEVMEEVQKVLDLIKSNSRTEIEEWFDNKFRLK